MRRSIRDLPWKELDNYCYQLAKKIKESGIKYERITAVARGGLVIAAALAYLLDIKDVYSVGLRSYEDQEKKEIYRYTDLPRKMKNTLIVDDICATGETLKFLYDNVEIIDCHFVTIFKQDHYEYPFNLIYVEQVEDWVNFPYEIKKED